MASKPCDDQPFPSVSELLAKQLKGPCKEYDILVSKLTNLVVEDEWLANCLKELRLCVSDLGKEFEVLVGCILRVDWLSGNEEVIKEYKTFLINLVSAHTMYLKATLRMIVKNMAPKLESNVDENLRQLNMNKFMHLHNILQFILKIVPLAPQVLLPLLTENFPYANKHSFVLENYVKNLLHLTTYMPDQRCDILELVIDRITKLDVRNPRDVISQAEANHAEDAVDQDIFQMDGIIGQPVMCLPEADKLDVLMDVLFTFIYSTCHQPDMGKLDWEACKKLYKELLVIFERILLPTHSSCHIQFIMFYICSFKQPLYEGFVDYLWKKVKSPNTHAVFRQAAVAYVGSMIARGRFINLQTVEAVLTMLIGWVHQYIVQTADTTSLADAKHHGPFYSVCQTIFYIFIFRHKEILARCKGDKFCQGLNFQTIITCRLNPLRICLPIIMNTFSSIARQHQLAYCDTIIERNRRTLPSAVQNATNAASSANPLDTFFPFDPYVLHRSIKYINDLYKEFDGTPVTDNTETEDEVDTEEEYMDSDSVPGPSSMQQLQQQLSCDNIVSPKSPVTSVDLLMYGTSPGFHYV